jgi:BMFP domain-containing protein YqiC
MQTNNRLFEEFGRVMTDAAGVAQGFRREAETVMRNQAERVLAELDVVRREEFEAVKTMAANAREENERLSARLAALEARLADVERGGTAPSFPGGTVPGGPTIA